MLKNNEGRWRKNWVDCGRGDQFHWQQLFVRHWLLSLLKRLKIAKALSIVRFLLFCCCLHPDFIIDCLASAERAHSMLFSHIFFMLCMDIKSDFAFFFFVDFLLASFSTSFSQKWFLQRKHFQLSFTGNRLAHFRSLHVFHCILLYARCMSTTIIMCIFIVRLKTTKNSSKQTSYTFFTFPLA